ncbi:uncharacterized protein [Hemitrygon akajei]|uniref:uncharacterized protein n=1 Tax=Hemitrygon akajei TaxID=2704970 RepID=UPI003BFA0BFD
MSGVQELVSESFRLTVQTQINWEMVLTPMSTSVAILADLVLQAKSGKDFPFLQDPQSSENPKTFQGNLLDICLKAPNSFQSIHNNMRKIHSNCKDMRHLLKMVREEPGEGANLPRNVARMEKSIKKFGDAARDVEVELSSLNQQLAEILERCSKTQSCTQVQLQDVQRALDQTRQSIETVTAEKETLEEEWSRVSLERERIMEELNEVRSRAFTDALIEEGVTKFTQNLPQLLDLLGTVVNPIILVSEVGKVAKFILNEISALKNKDSSSALRALLDEVEKKAAEKIKSIQVQLDEAGEKYEQHRLKVENLSKQSAKLSGDLTTQQAEELDLSSTLLLMSKEMELLEGIRSNWSQAIGFIQLIPKLVGDCQKILEKAGGGGYGASPQAMVFQDQMSQADTIVALLCTMAETFNMIYDNYLKVPLKDLLDVLAQEGMDYKLKSIKGKCQSAEEEIHRRAKDAQEEFQKKLQQGSLALRNLAAQLGPRG